MVKIIGHFYYSRKSYWTALLWILLMVPFQLVLLPHFWPHVYGQGATFSPSIPLEIYQTSHALDPECRTNSWPQRYQKIFSSHQSHTHFPTFLPKDCKEGEHPLLSEETLTFTSNPLPLYHRCLVWAYGSNKSVTKLSDTRALPKLFQSCWSYFSFLNCF